jgi:hypothetical protein
MRNLLDPKIALGRDPYVKKYTLRGRNAAISTSAETVWGAGATYAHIVTPVAMEAISSNAGDGALGTGTKTVLTELIDGNFDSTPVPVTMNGTSAVAISGTYLGSNLLRQVTAGSGLTNAGTIDIRTVSGSVVKRRILVSGTPVFAGGQDTDFVFIVPRNHMALLGSIYWSGTTITGSVTVGLLRVDLTTGLQFWENSSKISLDNTSFSFGQGFLNLGKGLVIPEKNAIELQVITTAGVGDFSATAELFLFDLRKISWV